MSIDSLLARGLLPDWLIRQGIRSLLRGRLREQGAGNEQAQARARAAFIEELRASPIAIDTEAANRQHWKLSRLPAYWDGRRRARPPMPPMPTKRSASARSTA